MRRRIGQSTSAAAPQASTSQAETYGTPESSSEVWGARRRPQTKPRTGSIFDALVLIPSGIVMESPSGGQEFTSFINIDCMLQILFSLWKFKTEARHFFNDIIRTSDFSIIFTKIESKEFYEAKLFAIEHIMKTDPAILLPTDFIFSEVRFIRNLSPFFVLSQKYNCKKNCIMSQPRELKYLTSVSIRSAESIPILLKKTHYESQCKLCREKDVVLEYSWGKEGILPFIAYAVSKENGVKIEEKSLPLSIVVIGVQFRLYAYTYYLDETFFAVFKHENQKFLYNSKNPESLTKCRDSPPGHEISSIWYIPKGPA